MQAKPMKQPLTLPPDAFPEDALTEHERGGHMLGLVVLSVLIGAFGLVLALMLGLGGWHLALAFPTSSSLALGLGAVLLSRNP